MKQQKKQPKKIKLAPCPHKDKCDEYTDKGIPCTNKIKCGLKKNFRLKQNEIRY
jgi:hypothetical protein